MATKLNEYTLEIKNDEDLERWKSTWDGISEPPKEINHYMRTVVLPGILKENSEFINSIFKK
jgi:hypothetical protein